MTESISDVTSIVQAAAAKVALNLSTLSLDLQIRLAKEVNNAFTAQSTIIKALVQDRIDTFLHDVKNSYADLEEGFERHRKAHVLVSAVLPTRGWYLSGHEPCTLSSSLACSIQDEDWEQVDREVMDHLPKFNIKHLSEELTREGVPDFCIDRICRFTSHHNDKNYEEATYLGVPLIDEVSRYLYAGKALTTKRGNTAKKPEIGIKSSNSPELNHYCSDFLAAFGTLQEDSDPTRLDDRDYWNRHAIVHGMMKRAMGEKDSAKCLMAINFLFFARKDDSDSKYG